MVDAVAVIGVVTRVIIRVEVISVIGLVVSIHGDWPEGQDGRMLLAAMNS